VTRAACRPPRRRVTGGRSAGLWMFRLVLHRMSLFRGPMGIVAVARLLTQLIVLTDREIQFAFQITFLVKLLLLLVRRGGQ
jgi:hypothetical protein